MDYEVIVAMLHQPRRTFCFLRSVITLTMKPKPLRYGSSLSLIMPVWHWPTGRSRSCPWEEQGAASLLSALSSSYLDELCCINETNCVGVVEVLSVCLRTPALTLPVCALPLSFAGPLFFCLSSCLCWIFNCFAEHGTSAECVCTCRSITEASFSVDSPDSRHGRDKESHCCRLKVKKVLHCALRAAASSGVWRTVRPR